MKKPVIWLALLLVAITAPQPAGAQAETPFDLQAAIRAAEPGATIRVPPGIYPGPVVVDKAVHLLGVDRADGQASTVDGGGVGTVLTVIADGAVVEKLTIRNSGQVIDREDGGIVVDGATDVALLNNRLVDVLYGIRGLEAHRLVVRGNHITGKDLETARRGDGLRLWQSEETLVEGNTLEHVRDAIFWFSDGATVRDNVFRFNRYGVHMMYTDGMTVVGNLMSDNSVGAYLMYSVNVQIRGNTFRNNRGPSGYGVAMKDMDGVGVHENYFLENRVGLFFDNSPARVDVEQSIRRNVLAYNDIGVLMMPAVQRNILHENSFIENLEQVGVKGGGSQGGDQLGGNGWTGNYWSDYVGYDAAPTEDGVGDLPYRSESLFENLSDRHPSLKLFHLSPVEEAVDLAAKAFPVIKPKPKLTDPAPRMAPLLPSMPLLTGAPATEPHREPNRAATGPRVWPPAARRIGLVLALVILALPAVRLRPGRGRSRQDTGLQPPDATPEGEMEMITVDRLTKRYPRPGRPWWSDATITAVDGISFRLERGQALALWGANGAGKTTLLKCLLGLLDCQGEIRLDERDLRRAGRDARRFLGYVPQELAFHNDMRVAECCRFYARLKQVKPARIPAVLAQVGLTGQEHKAVGALSGGMKQRLALALALLADPPVLLLDEPTSNLDAAARDEFMALLVTLRDAGKTFLFTSHHREEVDRLADRVLVLQDGRVVEERTIPRAHAGPVRDAQAGEPAPSGFNGTASARSAPVVELPAILTSGGQALAPAEGRK